MRPLKKKGKGEPPAVGFRNIKTREEEEQNGELFTADGDSRATRSNGNNFNPQDVPGCLKTCRKFFFEDFVAVDNPEKGAASKENCEVLRDGYESTTLWALYACDAFQCGVYIDLEGPLGQSPSVDLIINECQNAGVYGVDDPGPPDHEPQCVAFSGDGEGDPPCLLNPVPKMPGTTAPADGFTAMSVAAISPTTTSQVEVVTISSPYASSPSAASASASASVSNPSSTSHSPSAPPYGIAHNSTSEIKETSSPSSRLSTGVKVAVGICSGAALLALISALIFLFLRRRRRRHRNPRKNYPSTTNHSRGISETPSGSHTPLISPPPSSSSKTIPSTPPPLRLSDRKFLPSILKPAGEYSLSGVGSPPPLSTNSTDLAFPKSPICTPRTTKMVPHHERHTTKSSIRSGNLSPSAPMTKAAPPRSSQGSNYSGAVMSSKTIASSSNSHKHSSVNSASGNVAMGTPPLSPNRPPRPHGGPLEIPDLVTPAGPPPNRALPQPPSYSLPLPMRIPISPVGTFPVSPISPLSSSNSPNRALAGPIGHPALRHDSDSGVCLFSVPVSHPIPATAPAPAPASSQDLCELTESYTRERRETRESWGSWSGSGGGGPGVVGVGGRKKGGFGSNSPRSSGDKKGGDGRSSLALQELDLEKLGGSYRGRAI